jgi:hypothetical protein
MGKRGADGVAMTGFANSIVKTTRRKNELFKDRFGKMIYLKISANIKKTKVEQ